PTLKIRWLTLYALQCGLKSADKPYDPNNDYPLPADRGDSDEAAKTAGFIFGAGLLGHHIGKHHKSSSDRAADDWLWQEK
ncbi:MAG: hypothetical protein Q4B16_05905, partial [Bacteroidia bacterium]|nr:hypothetical protein [Bacteroidia bacterium]